MAQDKGGRRKGDSPKPTDRVTPPKRRPRAARAERAQQERLVDRARGMRYFDPPGRENAASQSVDPRSMFNGRSWNSKKQKRYEDGSSGPVGWDV